MAIMIAVTQVNFWCLLSSQGVDNTGDVYRATYTAFRCSRVSGTLGAYEKMQVGTHIQLVWCNFLFFIYLFSKLFLKSKTQCSENVVGYVGNDVSQYADTSQTKIVVYLFI